MRFWQLGIKPHDQPKIAFCIPNHHFQWIVMPFVLKTAPSLFQKAMTRIYSLILNQALVYIEDILLFSPSQEAHLAVLAQFKALTKQHGVML